MVRTRARFLILSLIGLLAAFGLHVVAAAPAAAIPGLINSSVGTIVDSSLFKSVTAPCPAGTVVIGGGGRITISTGEVSITHLAPTAAGTGYEVRAYEDFDGFAGNWGLVVTAVCANPIAGYQIVTVAGPMGSPATANITAGCTPGLQVLGTGGAVFPGRGVVVLTGIIPNPTIGTSGVTVTGAEVQGGFSGSWNVTAWAICAAPVAGHITQVTTSAIDSLTPKTQITPCPGGRPVHGLGFQFGGAGVGEVFLNMAFPNPLGPIGLNVPVVASEDQSGVLGNWGIRTYALCAP